MKIKTRTIIQVIFFILVTLFTYSFFNILRNFFDNDLSILIVSGIGILMLISFGFIKINQFFGKFK